MEIHRESPEPHSIQTYGQNLIRIASQDYTQSLIVNKTSLIPDWPIHSLAELTMDALKPLLALHPKIILIGHQTPQAKIPMIIFEQLSKQRIGLEVMSLGAMVRTFNLLLAEEREVAAGIIF